MTACQIKLGSYTDHEAYTAQCSLLNGITQLYGRTSGRWASLRATYGKEQRQTVWPQLSSLCCQPCASSSPWPSIAGEGWQFVAARASETSSNPMGEDFLFTRLSKLAPMILALISQLLTLTFLPLKSVATGKNSAQFQSLWLQSKAWKHYLIEPKGSESRRQRKKNPTFLLRSLFLSGGAWLIIFKRLGMSILGLPASNLDSQSYPGIPSHLFTISGLSTQLCPFPSTLPCSLLNLPVSLLGT